VPSCRPEVIPSVLYQLMELKPGTILDVGAGHGKWGVLCDEYLRYWSNIVPQIDAVEVHGAYESHAYGVYREVFQCDVMSMVGRGLLGKYDLVLLVDVIEHLSKEGGMRLLGECKGYLVSTPNYWSEQGACFGNEHERHVSQWTGSDFANHSITKGTVGGDHVLGWK